MAEEERSRDVDRVLTYVDAIVAIAVTLLVLPLVEVTRDVDRYHSVGGLLRHNSQSVLAFALSFLIITRYWLAQHRTMRHVTSERRSVVLLLMAWAMTVVFLPFPTALIAQRGEQSAAKALYLGTAVASTLLLGALARVVQRHPEITDGHDDTDPVDSVVTAVTLLLALGVMLVAPTVGYLPLLLLTLTDALSDVWRRLRGGTPRHWPLARGRR